MERLLQEQLRREKQRIRRKQIRQFAFFGTAVVVWIVFLILFYGGRA